MAYTLQLLHANDLEGGVDALVNAPNFAAITDTLDDSYANTVILSSGDNYIPGPFFSTAADFSMGGTLTAAYTRYYTEVLGEDLSGVTLDLGRGGGRVDISIMNIIGFDAAALGNHEFDPGTSAMAGIIGAEVDGAGLIEWPGTFFPYLSANLDFTGDGALAGLATDQIVTAADYNETLADLAAGNVTGAIAPATIIEEGGEQIGVVGATTQLIELISSTGGVDEVTNTGNDMAALAAVLQPQIDALIAQGIDKIILTSHLQQFALDVELAGYLSGVDIIVAGGSNTLQADGQDRLRSGDTVEEAYPYETTNADGDPLVIVGTDGEYSYVGRLVVEFDDNGVINTGSIDDTVSGVFATDAQGVLDVSGAPDLATALTDSVRADIVEDLTSAVGAIVAANDAIVYGAHEVYLEGRREAVRTEETNLGDLTADANLAAAQAVDTTVMVSLKNGGGIRAEIGTTTDTGVSEGDGAISQLDIENSLRFDNGLTLVTLSTEGLLQILEHAVAATDSAAGNTPGQFAQVGGIRFSFDETAAAQVLSTDENGDYISDPNTGLVQTDVEGQRIQTVALIDPATGEDIVIVRDGELTEDAPAQVRMVTLNFLAAGGDGYPFPELGSDVAYLTTDGATTTDENAPNLLGEQEAFADYMTATYPDANDAFAQAETDVANDTRIVQLAQNGNRDIIISDDADASIDISLFGTLLSGETQLFTGGSEVVATENGRAYVTNGAQDQVDVFDVATQAKLFSIDLTAGIADYDGVQSVAVKNGLVAVAIAREAADGSAMNGVVAIYDTGGTLLNTVEVGNLPDMVTFTPNGAQILVANEGEPTDATDPLGSVSIIDVSGGAAAASVTTLDFTGFDGQEAALSAQGVLLEPGKSVSEDLEPEYITVLPDGQTAWVSLQEANAYAVVDLTTSTITEIRSFGLIDRALPGNEIDASNKDDAINLQSYDNLFSMRQPDAISAFEVGGQTYVVTANEGDARDDTEADVEDLTLDPTAFPAADILQLDENLGNLKVRSDLGDTDGDGDYDQLYTYGGRSFTIYDETGAVVFESASTLSRLIAEIRPDLFNADDGEFDGRSDNKGVEPEAIAVGEVDGRPLLFVGLERDNGVFVFDLSDPSAPAYVNYIAGEDNGNISPETIAFVPAADSVTGEALILVAYEGDGNTAVYSLSSVTLGQTLGAADAIDTLLIGGEASDTVTGLGGDDSLWGAAGDDSLLGGDGADRLGGSFGNDVIGGEAGDDSLYGVSGHDTLDGGAGDDAIWGGFGDDQLSGGTGNDTLRGGAGYDEILGGDGDDLAWGYAGADTLRGEAGDDSLWGGAGDDLITGGADNDALGGGAGNDEIWGYDGDDAIFGGAGDDTLGGGAGNDEVWAGTGADVVYGGAGADSFVFIAGFGQDQVVDFTDNTDTLVLSTGLWAGTLTAAEVVSTFATVVGGDTVFDFGSGNTLTLSGITNLAALEDDIAFL